MINWREKLNLKKLVLLSKSQNCESCGESFACEITLKGCWCGRVKVNNKTREYLRRNYKRCLCRSCLEKFEKETSEGGKINWKKVLEKKNVT